MVARNLCSVLSACSSFLLLYAYGHALRGPTGSPARSVAVLLRHTTETRIVVFVATLLIVVGVSLLTWVRIGTYAYADHRACYAMLWP